MDRGNFHNISLGQGQEVVAEAAMDMAAKEGHWVILQVRISCIFDVTRSLFSDTNKWAEGMEYVVTVVSFWNVVVLSETLS